MIRDAIGDSTFFRSDVDTYCSDDMPRVDPAVLEVQLRKLGATEYPFRIEYHPPLPIEEMMEFYRDPNFKRQTERACTLISNYAFVDPRGRLYPCLTRTWGMSSKRRSRASGTERSSGPSGGCCGGREDCRCVSAAPPE